MAASTMYVTVAGAGTKEGNDWDNAMGYAEWESDMEGSAEAGDVYYVAGGTYTLTSNLGCLAGATENPVKIIGVNSGTTNEGANIVAADYATGDNRPLIACGASYYMGANASYLEWQNFRATGSSTTVAYSGTYSLWVNCKAFNSSAAANRDAFSGSSYVQYVSCEGISTAGFAMDNGTGQTCIYCYFHDSNVGADIGTANQFFGCVFDTCTTGYNFYLHGVVVNCTFYNCTTGISGSTNYKGVLINNIFDACTTGATFTNSEEGNFFDYNVWDNTTDITNCSKGIHDITGDPGLTNPASGDFTLGDGSNAIDAGTDASDAGATV